MPKPLVCVTVAGATMAELRRARDAVRDADLIELRLDSVSDPSVAGGLHGRRLPVIVTCRPTWEGGQFAGSEEERRRLLDEALALGAEHIDIEWRAGWTDLITPPVADRIVLSMHDLGGVPADLPARLGAMRATGAGTVKIAVTARCLSDCRRLIDLDAKSGRCGRVVLIAMGEYGLATRVLAGRFGSAWTYAGPLAGVGQVQAGALLNEYRFREIGEGTSVYGVTGGSVAHSVSPAMHNAAFKAAAADAVYLPLASVSAEDFLGFAKAIGLRGASVTMPHKVALGSRLDEVDPLASRVGAINTIRAEDGRWVGTNTDVSGFLRPLARRLTLSGLRASVLGGGGAARAVAVALASSGAVVRVHARKGGQAEEVARIAGVTASPWPPAAGTWDLLVNCTPIGQRPCADETPLDAELLRERGWGPATSERSLGAASSSSEHARASEGSGGGAPRPMRKARGRSPRRWVYDLVYNPPTTRLLREAAAAGCGTIGGLEMLVAQAQDQFVWWTGSAPARGVMEAAARRQLEEFGW